MPSGKEKNVDLISQNYHEMNETGKEKLKEVSDLLQKIWVTVNKDPVSNQKKIKERENLSRRHGEHGGEK